LGLLNVLIGRFGVLFQFPRFPFEFLPSLFAAALLRGLLLQLLPLLLQRLRLLLGLFHALQ